jgi:small subunit ribosomal protein S16
MATKIRLQRHGKKGLPFYHLVVADSRAKRDGRFIEKLGTYNPNTNPATIDINFDSTLNWVSTGAEMSDTARAILSYKGVLYKNHLLKGVKKGAHTEADVETKFAAWLKDKEDKISKKSDGLSTAAQKAEEERLAAEKAVSEARAKEIAAKNAPEEVEEAPVEAEAATEEVAPEAKAEEVTPEKKEEEKKEEAPKAEEKPAEEAKKEEKKEDK